MRELTDLLNERASKDGVPINVVRKEALQIYALAEIFGRPESQALTLQGGTCLRLVYNGVRYSQDLDLIATLEADGLDDLLSKVRPGLAKTGPFFGYHLQDRVARADAEKALLDWIYLSLKTAGNAPPLDELDWESLDRERLEEWVAHYPRSVAWVVNGNILTNLAKASIL